MIYTEKTRKAMDICFRAHKDQTDKAGAPYVFHPFYVADRMKDEATTVAALLHDIVKNTDYTFERLREEGFSAEDLEHNSDLSRYGTAVKSRDIMRVAKYQKALVLLR